MRLVLVLRRQAVPPKCENRQGETPYFLRNDFEKCEADAKPGATATSVTRMSVPASRAHPRARRKGDMGRAFGDESLCLGHHFSFGARFGRNLNRLHQTRFRPGIHPGTAVGTDLLDAAATKAVGTGVHGRARSVDWRIVRRLAAGSIPAAMITFLVMQRMAVQGARGGMLVFLPGVVLLLVSPKLMGMLRCRPSGAHAREPRLPFRPFFIGDLAEQVLGHRKGLPRGQGAQGGADVLGPGPVF